MWLVVGLGNPGVQYEKTRHNVGFDSIDLLARDLAGGSWSDKDSCQMARGNIGGERVILLKPMTYMNLSGEAVAWAMRYYKVGLDSLVVLHDELDLPFGKVRLKKGGGEAGHNGLKSISKLLGSREYMRVRLGIGKPENSRIETAKWVLSRFVSDEMAVVEDMCKIGAEAAEAVIREGFVPAQARVNQR